MCSAPTWSAARRIAKCVAFRMLSSSISFGLALATAHLQPRVDLIASASRSRLAGVSFFESLISLHAPASSSSASASGTETAAA